MFNTGTVVDVFANVYGEGFLPNYIPSFSWGGTAGLTTYKLEKALDTAEKVLGRRDIKLSDTDRKILEHVFEVTKDQRRWESRKSSV
jgi:hypothetical protein